ncbi:MAG: hypothetical protein ACREJO_09605 [Phycisphaerales bacterium]
MPAPDTPAATHIPRADAAAPDLTAPAPDLHSVLDSDFPCLRCGYNLRGLHHHGHCPECGTPIERSLSGDLLRFCAPEYLRKLARGTLIIGIGIVLYLLALCVFAGTSVGYQYGPGPRGWQALAMLACMAGAATVLWGWWFAASPDPGRLTEDDAVTSRKVLRASLIIVAAALAGAFLMAGWSSGLFGLQPGYGTSFHVGAIGMGCALVAAAAWLAAFVSGMLYIRSLARRLPNGGIENFAVALLILGPLILTVTAWNPLGLITVPGLLIAYVAVIEQTRVALRDVLKAMPNS